MKNKLIKKYQTGGNYQVTYTDLDKLKGYEWYDGTELPSYRHPIVLPVFNKKFTPRQYIQEAEQFVEEHPDQQLVYLNPVVIKPFDGKIFDNANFSGGKRVNKLIDSQGRVIFENKTGQRLRDLIEVNYNGGKGYVDWDPWTNKKKLVAYQLPNDQYPRELPEGYDINSLEDEWNLQHNINYQNWREDQLDKPKVTTDSFKSGLTLPDLGSAIKNIGKFLLDGFVRFGNAQIAGDSGAGTAMAIASGWNHNPETGMWEQSEENIKKTEELRNNLSFISGFSPTHPLSVLFDKVIVPGAVFIGNKGYQIIKPALEPYFMHGANKAMRIPWIRNQFVANQIRNNVANTNLQIPNNINFGAKYITTTPYKYNIHGDNKSNIEWLQGTGQLQPKSQSNLTQLEQLGVPKDIRNMTSNKKWDLRKYYTRIERDPQAISSFKEWFSNDGLPLDVKGNYEIPIKWDPFSNDLPDEMLQFIKSLPEPDVKYSDNYIRFYRNYLTNADYNHEILSDLDIQKILNASNTQLVKNQSGLMKGKHVFHATNQNLFDHFDWRKTGENTLNMGGQGPGNYFSAHGSAYGTNNFQPYLINNVDKILPGSVKQPYFRYTSTPNELSQIAKKDLKLITPDNPLYNTLQSRRNEIQNAINTTKESNTIYYGRDIPFRYFEAPLLEFALPRNTGIKSLFPHPETFIKNSDGSISLIRDWNDFRLNYKTGGKFKNT